MILDTSFVIDLMQNAANAVVKFEELSKKGEPLSITTPTVYELFTGIARSTKPDVEKQKVMKVLNEQLALPLDHVAAERAGEIHGKLTKEGRGIGPLDCMIAGIALVKKEKILTGDIKDFSRVEGLEIVEY